MTRQLRIALLIAMAILCTAAMQSSAVSDTSLPNPAQGVSAQLIGGWSLQSRVTTSAEGKYMVDPGLSATPKGLLIYDASGHVAAQLSRPGRSVDMLADECRKAMEVKGTNDTSQTLLGYDAYFGTYTVDEVRGIVTHHLESALYPGDVGKSIIRHFVIAGDVLTIKFTTTQGEGTAVIRTLIFSRLR